MEEDRSTLAVGEPHPAAHQALEYLTSLPMQDLVVYQGSFASCAIAGSRLAEVCSGTLHRLMTQQPVSDRYILGLAWAVRSMREGKNTSPA